jgi:pyruvate,water dikinase
MIYFGLLKKQCEKISSESGNLHNDLLAGSRDIVSTEPVRRILDITSTVLDHTAAAAYFKNHTAQEVWENLWQWPDIQQKVKDYLATFGERTVGELKLETITYTQDPLSFIEIVQSYVAQGIRKRLSNEEEHIRAQAEATARAAMRGKPIKGALFWFLVRKTRILVSARENLRYERTRGFGMVRRMFLAIGKQFYAEHLIEQPRDIFYLTRDEIFDFIKGTAVSLQIKPLIAMRQSEYAQYATEGPLAERIITHGVVYHANDFKYVARVKSSASEDSGVLKGLGCSAGIVRGKVRVVHQAHETRSLDGDILVTSSTDPGWVTLFPSASAILVERGSLLSHSAIVSRELGIPCVVGISGLLQTLKTGDVVEMDGTRGTVTIISQNAQS